VAKQLTEELTNVIGIGKQFLMKVKTILACIITNLHDS